METMKTQMLRHSDIKYAFLFEHEDGRQVLTLRLANDLEIRIPSDGKATISGFLNWGEPTQRYIENPVEVMDGIGL